MVLNTKGIKKSELLSITVSAFFVLSIFGYPFFASLSVAFGLPNTPVSMSYRFFVLLLGVFIIAFSLLNKPISLTKRGWLLFFFWILYGTLLVNDISVKGIRFKGATQFYLYSFIFGSCFISFATLLIGGRHLKLSKRLSWIIVLFLTVTLLMLNQSIEIYGTTSTGLFQGRVIVSTEESMGVVNPILIGSYGAFLSLTSLSLLIIRKEKMAYWKQGLLLISSIIGIVAILLSGSRGPLLLFIVGVILLFAKYVTFKRTTPVHLLKVSSIIIVGIMAFVFVFLPYIADNAITSFKRLTSTVSSNEGYVKEKRFYEWESAIIQYVNNPILGDKYVTDYDGYYPHNVYLEVLMSTGTIGGFLFFVGFFLCLKRMKKLWRRNLTEAFPIILFAATIFVMRLTSGALHNSVEFWGIIGLLCSTFGTRYYKLNTGR